MTQSIYGSRGLTASVEASLEVKALEDVPSSATMQVAAALLLLDTLCSSTLHRSFCDARLNPGDI